MLLTFLWNTMSSIIARIWAKISYLIYYTNNNWCIFELFSDSCSYNLTDVRGNFTSPDYPQHYAHDLDCSWTITVSAGYYIYLHFEHFHLEHAYGASECPYDFVEIFDGSSSSSPLIAKRCDYQDSWCVYSTSNVLHVNFESDYIIARSGFSAYYERVHTRYPTCLHLNSSEWMIVFQWSSPPSKSYILMSSIMTICSYSRNRLIVAY